MSDEAEVIANAMYTYDNIKVAAVQLRTSPKFAADAKVQKLKLSQKWVRGFLTRAGYRRRRVTTEGKKRPSVEQVDCCSSARLRCEHGAVAGATAHAGDPGCNARHSGQVSAASG